MIFAWLAVLSAAVLISNGARLEYGKPRLQVHYVLFMCPAPKRRNLKDCPMMVWKAWLNHWMMTYTCKASSFKMMTVGQCCAPAVNTPAMLYICALILLTVDVAGKKRPPLPLPPAENTPPLQEHPKDPLPPNIQPHDTSGLKRAGAVRRKRPPTAMYRWHFNQFHIIWLNSVYYWLSIKPPLI